MHGHIRERKEIPNDIWHSNFAMPKHTNVILWLVDNSGEMVINAFLSDFLVIPVKKSDMSQKEYKRQLNLTHHKQEPQSSLA